MPSTRRRVAALVGSVGLGLGLVVGLAAPASAEVMDSITVEATVSADTSLRVVETIDYDFEMEFRHGIFRDIPLYDEMSDGRRRVYDVTVNSVTMDGQTVPVEASEDGPYLNLRIGDPDVTITGLHTYVIDYTVSDALRVITAEDMKDPQMPASISEGDVELYWDLVGSAWQVDISSATATVSGPGDILSAACFTGAFGSTDTCPVTVDGASASYGPVRLNAYSGLTGVTVYPAAAFSRVPTENIKDPPANPLLGIPVGLIPALALIVGPVLYARSKRSEDAGVDLPGSPPQYSPPDGLAPAAMYAAWKGDESSAHSRMLVATLVDLAARRWINLSSAGDDLQVTWVGTGSAPMLPWEESLVGAILKGQPSATLSGYDAAMATLWATSCKQLETESEQNGRRNPTGDAPDQRWGWLAAVWLVCFGAAFGAFIFGLTLVAFILGTMGVGALIGFIAARIITPRKETEQSAQFQAKVRGFAVILGTDAAASRREFAQRLGLPPEAVFATMLPFAIVLQLESAWIGAYPDLTPEQLSNYGFYYVGWGSMYAMVSSGTSSISSAMTAPSSGSGGGGFSGGGGGGGGGGSW